MENGTSVDQGSHMLYGSRDVAETAEFYNWSELAEASQTESNLLGRDAHIVNHDERRFKIIKFSFEQNITLKVY